ncbi:MAG TPA: 5-formyltetrahydrofolate cyclo-ligase [Jatrophihabitans sp.]|nr:5-formyltetrahydrofolate cyclo-ligase [Jatrophihabitans sp.]
MHDAGSARTASAADKAVLRRRYLEARAALPVAALDEARAAVRAHVLERQAESGWRCVAGYIPLRTEPGSLELLAALRARDVDVLVPITLPDRDLDWARWEPDGLGPALGVGAIGRADAVLVPALAVADDGIRLGRGGGSYDRALSRVGPRVATVALLHAGERVARLPRDPWDVPVAGVVAPTGWERLAEHTDLANRD